MNIVFGHNMNFKNGLNKRLFGCPICQSSNYLIFTKIIVNRHPNSRDLYCHYCNIAFSRTQAVTPIRQ